MKKFSPVVYFKAKAVASELLTQVPLKNKKDCNLLSFELIPLDKSILKIPFLFQYQAYLMQ